MDCTQLDAYLDGALPCEARDAFEQHLAACPRCSAQVGQTERAFAALAHAVDERIRPDLAAANAEALVRRARATHEAPATRGVGTPASDGDRSGARPGTGGGLRTVHRGWQVWAAVAAATACAAGAALWLARDADPVLAPPDAALPIAVLRGDPERTSGEAPAGATASRAAARALPGAVFQARTERPALIRVGGARVGLARRTRVAVLQADHRNTRVALEQGRLAAELAPAAAPQALQIEARGYRVTVLGTRFLVELLAGQRLAVGVERGTVAVEGPGVSRQVLRAGQRLVASPAGLVRESLAATQRQQLTRLLAPVAGGDGQAQGAEAQAPAPPSAHGGSGATGQAPAHQAAGAEAPAAAHGAATSKGPTPAHGAAGPTASASPPAGVASAAGQPRSRQRARRGQQSATAVLAELRAQAAAGSCDRVIPALEQRLAVHADDLSGWELLATCLRKLGRTADAVAAYHRLVEAGAAGQRARALYHLGVLQQERLGRHAEAVASFERYLASGRHALNRSEARLRLARSLIAIGQRVRALPLLEALQQEKLNLEIAEQARRLLESTEAPR